MKYLSVCSGIEAASCAWHPLGWEPVAFSEIEPFPAAVLAHRFPSVPNWGDMTKFQEWPDATVDLLVGGTPCQSFSVAGLRKGLADPRGNLALTYLAIAARYRPAWVVWENVPGVLSDAGNAFGNFLAGLSELGYGWAYRILDAQYVRVESHPRAVPQRRRRVFVVGHLGDWRRAAAVLFERESLRGHPAPRRETGQGIANSLTERPDRGGGNSEGQRLIAAPTLSARTQGGGGLGTDFDCDGGLVAQVADSLTVGANQTTSFVGDCVAHSLRAEYDGSEDGTGRGTPLIPAVTRPLTAAMGTKWNGNGDLESSLIPAVAWALQERDAKGADSDTKEGHLIPIGFVQNQRDEVRAVAGALAAEPGMKQTTYIAQPAIEVRTANTSANGHGVAQEVAHTLDQAQGQAIAFHNRQDPDVSGDVTHPIGRQDNGLWLGMKVRRLTPLECERLQGFPDGWTEVPYRGKPAADGPRYKALGNSMAVNCMRWIGERIQQSVERNAA